MSATTSGGLFEDDTPENDDGFDCPHENTHADPDLAPTIRVCSDCESRLYLSAEQAAALALRDDD